MKCSFTSSMTHMTCMSWLGPLLSEMQFSQLYNLCDSYKFTRPLAYWDAVSPLAHKIILYFISLKSTTVTTWTNCTNLLPACAAFLLMQRFDNFFWLASTHIQMNCFYPLGSAVENDDFGDFAAFRTGSPTKNHLSDDSFTAFQSNTVLQVMYMSCYLEKPGFTLILSST